MTVANTVGKKACLKRFELLIAKYPAAASYLRTQLGGHHLERWGAAFLQTFTCKTRATSRGEGSNKDYKFGNKRNLNVLDVYENIVAVQENKKKRRLLTNVVNGLDVVGSVSCSELWFKEATRVVKAHCSHYALQLIAKEMAHSPNYRVLLLGLPGVMPDHPDVDDDSVTLTQGDNVLHVSEDVFDIGAFCKSLELNEDLDESDPFKRANLSEYISHHDIGEDYRVLTIKHWRYDVTHYIVLFGKVVLSGDSATEVYKNFYCTCGDSVTSGVPCRHFWAAHKAMSVVAFYLGCMHKRWITTTGLTTYDLVTLEGVIGTAPSFDPATLCTARVMNPSTQTLMDVPIDVFKHSRVCYGKLWGLCRKVTSAVTVDYGHVHHKEFEEVVATLERILKQVQARAEMEVAPEENRHVLRELQNISNVQDPSRKNNKSKENRLCGYCRKSAGHNRASCPVRFADEAAKAASTSELVPCDTNIPLAVHESVNVA